MKVSALITTYNYGRFLSEAVDSVLTQDYGGDIECIVVDDGSTDDTPRVAALYGERIRYIRQANAGQAAALNAAYGASSGEALCLLDADDVWEPDKVAAVVDAFRQDPAPGLVHHGMTVVDAKGDPHPEFPHSFGNADGDLAAAMRKTALRWMFAPTSGLSLTRSVADRVFPLRTGLKSSADELVAPIAALLAPVRYVARPLARYRIHGSNVWATGAVAGASGEAATRAADRWYVVLLEEKVAQANDVLRRSGAGGRLTPWLKWNYVKAVAATEGRLSLSYLPRVAAEALAADALGAEERFALLWTVLRKSLREARKRRFRRPPGPERGT